MVPGAKKAGAILATLAALAGVAESGLAATLPDSLDLGAVGVGGGGTDQPAPPPAPPPAAVAIAPTSTPLSVTQPTSNISRAAIEQTVPPSGSYDEIIRTTPSVVAISPNGPGLSEAADLTIRGFTDGQYNVTFDGIPFGDADDFSHHTTAYFGANVLGGVSVDRGPGTAATIGNATFGGTVALQSIAPSQTFSVTPFASVGSFDTHLFDLTVNTGAITTLNGGTYVLDAEHLGSNGYLTESGQQRSSLFFKAVQPLNDTTLLTIVSTGQALQQYQPAGATAAQIASFGPNYALSNNPASQNFYRFNGETYRTDFSYVGIQSQLSSGLLLDNKTYSYALVRHFNNGEDVNGETPNGTAFSANDVPGQLARNDLRAYGDVLRLVGTLPFGVLRTGFWVEYQANQRSQYEVDETLGGVPNPVLTTVPGVPGSAAIDRTQQETLTTVQPYAEFEWHVTEALSITPGLKYALFDRSVDAPVMEGTRLPLQTYASYGAPLPSVALHYQVTHDWSAYAQVAKGFLAPQLQFLDVPDPKADPVAPEQTWNVQAGTVWHGPRVALSADAYYIDFINMVGSRTIGSETEVFNEGGVNYLGLEGDATVKLAAGFSLYGNGSVNSARQRSTKAPVPNVPQATVAGGLLYENAGWTGSLLDKWVGGRYGDTDRQQWLQPFSQLDFSAGWKLQGLGQGVPPAKLQAQVLNILDSRKINALAGYTVADTTPLYFTQAGRSLFLSASVVF